MYLHKRYSLLLLLLLLFLTGCSHNDAYRSNLNVCVPTPETNCSASALIHHQPGNEDEYYLGFVEFDDQGQIRERLQMERVLDTFYELAGLEDVLLVTFVHGWHHNAAPDDSNVKSFQNLLERLSRMESENSLSDRKARKVVGMYIGWRGESLEIPYINDLTFWERKNTAQNVGLIGVTELLLRLEEIVNVKAGIETDVPKPLNSRKVVIGHSFGGAVVFTSLQEVLSDRFINSRHGKTYSGDAQGFGDLVILVNPAFEAIRYSTLYDMTQLSDISEMTCRNYFPTQLPKLTILTSESDLATKWAFPAGRFFSTLFESHTTLTRHFCEDHKPVTMKIKEGSADRTAVGHFEPYLTHHLNATEHYKTRSRAFRPSGLKTAWSDQNAGDTLEFEGSRLTHLNRTHPLNPYLNIKVSSELIPDHNDIWGDGVVGFIHDLIVISTLPMDTGGK